MLSLEQLVIDQILSEPEHVQAQMMEDLPVSIVENISREKSIRRKEKAVAVIVPAMKRFVKKPDIQLLRWALHKYPVSVGQMMHPRTLRICLAQEIAEYYFDDGGKIDLNTFLRWLSLNEKIGGGSKLIDIIHQVLMYSGRKRQLFYTRILQKYSESINDILEDDMNISPDVRKRYYDVLKDGVDNHVEISYEDFKTLVPFIDDVDIDDIYGLLPRDIELDERDIALLMSLFDDKIDLLQFYATIPSFEAFNKHSRYFNR
jgi:hypothetical protein